MKTDDLISGLPGETLVRQGLADLQAGLCTIPACLVRIARTRLSRAGLMPQSAPGDFAEPELELYDMLKLERGDAYSRYNALVRELVSFENALERRSRWRCAQGVGKRRGAAASSRRLSPEAGSASPRRLK